MNLSNFIYAINKDRRKKERIKIAQIFGAGMGISAAVGAAAGIVFAPKSGKETRQDLKKKITIPIEVITNTVRKKTDTFKDNAANVAQKISSSIKDIHEEMEDVKKYIKVSCNEIAEDINKTDKDIS